MATSEHDLCVLDPATMQPWTPQPVASYRSGHPIVQGILYQERLGVHKGYLIYPLFWYYKYTWPLLVVQGSHITRDPAELLYDDMTFNQDLT